MSRLFGILFFFLYLHILPPDLKSILTTPTIGDSGHEKNPKRETTVPEGVAFP